MISMHGVALTTHCTPLVNVHPMDRCNSFVNCMAYYASLKPAIGVVVLIDAMIIGVR